MKKRIFTFLLAFMAMYSGAWASVKINKTNFPDATFRAYVKANCQEDNNDVLSDEEIDAVWKIDVSELNIAKLNGIEFFTMLQNLYCSKNKLTSIDVSKNENLRTLYCDDNQLGSLDVSKNELLNYLSCNRIGLTTLDVSANINLEGLDCVGNQLTSLDFSNNPKLRTLWCYGNQIGETEMGKLVKSLPTVESQQGDFCVKNDYDDNNVINTAQVAEAKAKNWKVTIRGIDGRTSDYEGSAPSGILINETNFPDPVFRESVKTNYQSDGDDILTTEEIAEVTIMYLFEGIFGTPISDLTGIEYFTELEVLSCFFNNLTTLDLSNNKKLRILTCNNNQIKGAAMDKLIASLPDTGGNLYAIAPFDPTEGNQMTANQVAAAKKKNWTVYCWSGDDAQTGDWVQYDTSILINETNFPDPIFREEVKNNCQSDGDNVLTPEEISEVTIMYLLDGMLSFTPISDLTGIGYFTELEVLGCLFNNLTTLDLSKNKKLRDLTCNNNQIKGAAMDKLIASLPDTGGNLYAIAPFDPTEGNEITADQVAAAKKKKWTVYCWTGETYQEGEWVEYNPTGIEDNICEPITNNRYYSLDGHRIDGKPTQKGVYIHNGKKVVGK